jgi:crossover junction endodeoxyribonuclease RusA
MIVIDVLGKPAPKGSQRAFVNKRTGRAILSSFGSGKSEKRLRSWDADVRDQAHLIAGNTVASGPVLVGKCLAVGIVFRLARPSGQWSKKGGLKPSAPGRPSVKPDIDKLARATLDALTGIVFDDDSRIVELALHKTYAEPGREGARIVVKEWKP